MPYELQIPNINLQISFGLPMSILPLVYVYDAVWTTTNN